MDYLPWLLDQMRQRSAAAGRRLLDVFTAHIYPQGGEFGNDVSPDMQLRRNRSTRALWDTNYVDETWIASAVGLIPRMKRWVAQYYPGTLIGLTEYNWGAESHINGATAQADVLGILGREGLDLATRWTTPAAATPAFKAMQMYRNYDGRKSAFGDVSMYAGGPDPDALAVFAAARRADGALTVMAVHKSLSGVTPATFIVTNFAAGGAAQVWQFGASNAIVRLSDVSIVSGAFTSDLPPQSISLFVLPPAPWPRISAWCGWPGGGFDLQLEGNAGSRYGLLSSLDLAGWAGVQTALLVDTTAWLTVPADTPHAFYRVVWLP